MFDRFMLLYKGHDTGIQATSITIYNYDESDSYKDPRCTNQFALVIPMRSVLNNDPADQQLWMKYCEVIFAGIILYMDKRDIESARKQVNQFCLQIPV